MIRLAVPALAAFLAASPASAMPSAMIRSCVPAEGRADARACIGYIWGAAEVLLDFGGRRCLAAKDERYPLRVMLWMDENRGRLRDMSITEVLVEEGQLEGCLPR